MDIDWTVVAFEILNFGVLVMLMRRFLFRPVQRALTVRREAIEKDRRDLEEREAAVTTLREEYDRRLREIDEQARGRLDAAVTEARAEAEVLVQQGREEARRLIGGAEQQTITARRRALEQLRLEVLALASEAATRIVQHMEVPMVACAYARRAAHGFASVLSGEDMPTVVQAATGEDADPDEIEKELRVILGSRVQIEISIDPQIVAGVRLRARGHEVEASASSSLRAWYEQQLANGDPAAITGTAA